MSRVATGFCASSATSQRRKTREKSSFFSEPARGERGQALLRAPRYTRPWRSTASSLEPWAWCSTTQDVPTARGALPALPRDLTSRVGEVTNDASALVAAEFRVRQVRLQAHSRAGLHNLRSLKYEPRLDSADREVTVSCGRTKRFPQPPASTSSVVLRATASCRDS